MYKTLINILNLILAAMSGFLLLASLILVCIRSNSIPESHDSFKKGSMPKNAFSQSKESYNAINEPFLSLKYHPMTAELPDLKKNLIFYGKNGRPDAMLTKPHMHFSFNGNKTINAVFPGDKIYLTYNKQANPPHYSFSKENEETSLWIEADIQEEDALVKVFMTDESGKLIKEPVNHATLTLKATPQTKFGSGNEQPEIGGFRIDGSLLARQKAKWHGPDRFLEKHGGEEFNTLIGKHRVDFGDQERIYSIFVSPGDCMIWKENKWEVVTPGTESMGNPLLVVKKVDDRIMNFELWDVEGKNKVVLNLIKAHESPIKQNYDDSFRFIGARTRSQFMFEIDDERMLLSPKDWLVLTGDGWKKITTAEEIDAYVERKMTAPLFVFDGIDKQVIYGTVFNPSRTDMQTIELPISQGAGMIPSSIENHSEHRENSLETPVARNYLQ